MSDDYLLPDYVFCVMVLFLSLPQSVQVAVFAGANVLGIGLELCHRFVGGVKISAENFFFCKEFDPLDVVFLGHGMLYGAYGYAVATLDGLNHGNVLLGCCVSGVLFQQFTITCKRTFACYHYLYDVAC